MNYERSERQFLQDILDACNDCLAFVEGFEFAEFLLDRKTNQATIREIGIIGEASNHIPESIRLQTPEIPWGRIVGMRNRLVHQYFDVDYELVWRTTQEDLQPLITSIRRVLDAGALAGETPGV